MYSDISVSAGYVASPGPYQAPIDAEPLLKRRRRGPLRLRKPRQVPRTETSRRVGNCHPKNITSESTYPLFFFHCESFDSIIIDQFGMSHKSSTCNFVTYHGNRTKVRRWSPTDRMLRHNCKNRVKFESKIHVPT